MKALLPQKGIKGFPVFLILANYEYVLHGGVSQRASGGIMIATNPKHEIRNSKQIQMTEIQTRANKNKLYAAGVWNI
jgi:hypothetical protein